MSGVPSARGAFSRDEPAFSPGERLIGWQVAPRGSTWAAHQVKGGVMGQEQIRIPRSGFVWHELMSTDPKQSDHFYGEVAGVAVTKLGEEPDGYQLLTVNGAPAGGMAGPRSDQEGWPSGGPEAHWIAYLGTDDVDRAARTAEELGGEVLLPPVDVPGMGRAAVLRDPQGAAFGVFEPE